MKTEAGRNDTDDLYFSLIAETADEEKLLRLLVKGIRAQHLMLEVICAADTDAVIELGKRLGIVGDNVETLDKDKPAILLCKVFEGINQTLRVQA